jgi:hypothetical protein
MVFEDAEIAKLDVRVVSSANSLAILYNSCAAAFSAIALFVIWSGLIYGQIGAFLILLFTIGFVQTMGFIAFSLVGNKRWQVNAIRTALYVLGIGLAGYSMIYG